MVAAQLWAFPELSRETKAACAACHTNVAGGEGLTDAGKAFKTAKTAPAAAAAVKAAEYVGNNKCKMCHMKQHKAWSATPHANAFSKLKAADAAAVTAMASKLKIEITGSAARTDACVKCHVTGFQLASGYPAADSVKTAALAAVSCESCHGPGSVHVTAPMADKKKFINNAVTAKMCMQCHTPEISPKFNFEEFAKKIHPVPKTAG
jgi:type IV secretory pathway VirB2 component (pilin)